MHVVNLRNLAHLYLAGGAVAEHYTTKRRGRSYPDPIRDRAAHSAALLASLNQALAAVPHQAIAPPQGEAVKPSGFYLEFRLPRGEEDFADKLEDRRRHIELVMVKPLEDGVSATVWVPLTAAEHFKKKIETYRDELTKGGKPKNQPLVSRIDSVALAALRSLYSDEARLFPVDEVPIWWEVWVRQGQTEDFMAASPLQTSRCSVARGRLLRLLRTEWRRQIEPPSIRHRHRDTPVPAQSEVFGVDAVKNYREARRLIGLSPPGIQRRPLRSSSARSWNGWEGYFGMPFAERRRRCDELLERFDLTEASRRSPFANCPAGSSAASFWHALWCTIPSFLILDEPTAGVDVELRRDLWRYLAEPKIEALKAQFPELFQNYKGK